MRSPFRLIDAQQFRHSSDQTEHVSGFPRPRSVSKVKAKDGFCWGENQARIPSPTLVDPLIDVRQSPGQVSNWTYKGEAFSFEVLRQVMYLGYIIRSQNGFTPKGGGTLWGR